MSMRWVACLRPIWRLRAGILASTPRQLTWLPSSRSSGWTQSATAMPPKSAFTAIRSSLCARRRSGAVSPISSLTLRGTPPRYRSPATATIAGSRLPSMTTVQGSHRICAKRYSSHFCGSTTRAIRTKAAPGWVWLSRAISLALTAATLCSPTVHSEGCEPPSGFRSDLNSNCLLAGLVIAISAPTTDAAQALRNPAEISEKARPALATCQGAIEGRHGARMSGIIVMHPDAQHRRTEERKSLRAHRTRRAMRRNVGSGQHPLLRAHRQAVERQSQAGIAPARAHQRAHRRLARLKQLDPAHEHIE